LLWEGNHNFGVLTSLMARLKSHCKFLRGRNEVISSRPLPNLYCARRRRESHSASSVGDWVIFSGTKENLKRVCLNDVTWVLHCADRDDCGTYVRSVVGASILDNQLSFIWFKGKVCLNHTSQTSTELNCSELLSNNQKIRDFDFYLASFV